MSRSDLKSILMESPLYEGEKDIDEVIQRNGLRLESGITRFFEQCLNFIATSVVTKVVIIATALYFVGHIIAHIVR